MARIRKAEEPQFTPGTPEFTMGQEQRRQARQEEEELQEMYRVLQDLSVSPDLSSSERQEVDDLIDEFNQSGHGIQESGFAGIGRAIGGAFKSPRAQKILGGIRQAPGVLRDKASSFFDKVRPKTKSYSDSFWDSIDAGKKARSAQAQKAGRASGFKRRDAERGKYDPAVSRNVRTTAGAMGAGLIGNEIVDRMGLSASDIADKPTPSPQEVAPDQPPSAPEETAPTGPSVVEDTRTPRQKRKFISTPGRPRGVKRMNPFYVPPPGGEEADPEAAQRPELPMTGVPGEQPEAIPDMMPTDQDIEGLFNGQGMPERFQDDPSKHAVSVAFRRERDKAFGRYPDTSMEGAPGLYEEPEGVDFIDTPEGQALLQNRMTPMSPEEQALPGGIDPLTQGVARIPVSPTPSDRDRDGAADRLYEIPGMTPRVPPRRPGPIRPELETTISPDQPEAIPDAEGIDLDRLMPELQRSGQTPKPQVKEDILDILATMQPQDPGPPTDDDIVSLFEGGNVPVSQLSQEEMEKELAEINARLEEQPNLPLTEEDEKRFMELLGRTRK